MRKLSITSLLALVTLSAFGQPTTGDFRSFSTGDWNNVNTWERFNGSIWVNPAPATPTNADGIITIMDTHVVTVTADVTADQIEWDNSNPFSGLSGSLIVASGANLTINNGAGDDIRIINDFVDIGLLQIDGALTLRAGATMVEDDYQNLFLGTAPISSLTYVVSPTGTHIHETGAGVDIIPAADWQSGSTCQINAIGSGAVPTIDPSIVFHHFNWNGGTVQAGAPNLAGGLLNVNGDFTIMSTNGSTLLMSTTQSYTLNIGGDFLIQNNSVVQITISGTAVINVGGDLNISSSNANGVRLVALGNTTVNVTGNFIKSGASTVNMSLSTGTSSLNLFGDFSLSAGSISKTNGTGTINFNGASTNTYSYTSGTPITNAVNFVVASLKTLDLGTSALTGGGALTLNGTLGLGSTDPLGALQTGTTAGNVRVPTRTYAAGSTIVYNSPSAQFIGNGFPSGGDVNLTVNKPGATNVTLSTSLDIVALRTLNLQSGNIVIGSQTLTINGTVSGSGGIVGGANSNLVIGGTGSFGTLNFSGTNQLLNFTMNRTSTGSVTLGDDLTVLGTFTQTDGVLNLNGNTLTLSGPFSRTSGTLGVDGSSSLVIDGSGSLPVGSAGIVGSTLGSFTLNRASSTLDVSASVEVTSLNIISGTVNNSANLGVTSGGTLTMGGQGALSNVLSNNSTGNLYNVVYNTTSPLTTGTELPSNINALGNLTKLGSGTCTLGSNVTVNGILTLTSGTFNSGANTLTMRGNFVSNASSNLNTVIAGATTTISGSTVPNFGDLTINMGSTLVAPSTNVNVAGTWDNNGSFSPSGGLVTFNGAGAQTIASNNIAFANVNFAGSGIKTITENLNVDNSLTISSTLNAGAQTISLAGAWINNGAFTQGTSTINFDGSSAISGTNPTTFRNIVVSGILNAPATLNVAGNIANSGGTFNAGVGTVVLNGSSLQTISGSPALTFNNLTVTNEANPNSVQITTAQNLAGILTLSGAGAGTKFNAGNLLLTLLSSDDEPFVADAAIAEIPSGAAISGNVIVQRYMSIEGGSNDPLYNNGRIYRYIASPVQNASVADLQNEIPVTGTFTTSSSCTGCGTTQSMFIYNEAETGDTNGSGGNDANDGYEDFPQNLSSETFAQGRGYSFFVRGNVAPISTNGNARYDLRGPVNSGTVDFVSTAGVSFTSSGVLANDGWNLIGNPYPSTIDWLSGGWTKSANVTNAIYMLDNGSAAGTYATYINGVGSNGGSQYIPIGQAFWVKLNAAGPTTLTATEAVKAPGQATEFFRQAPPDDLLRITLRNGNLRDEAVVYFDENASTEFDSQLDALKLDNSIFNLFTTSEGGSKFAISSVPQLDCAFTTDLQISNPAPGAYALDFTEYDSFTGAVDIILRDRLLDVVSTINAEPLYEFEITSVEETFTDRFELTIINREVNPNLLAQGKDGELCQQGSVTLEADGAPVGGSYRWYENDTDLEPIVGAVGSQFETPELVKPKTYYVSAVSDLGCEGPKMPVLANVINYDNAEIVEAEGALSSNFASGNQWFKDGSLLPGANDQTYVPTESGVYKVEVSIGACKTSSERVFTVTGLEDENLADQLIVVYPNPVTSILTLRVTEEVLNNPSVIDLAGKVVGEIELKKEGKGFSGSFDFSGKADGIYLIQFSDKAGSVYNKRIIKK